VSAGSGYYLDADPEGDRRIRLVFSTLSEDELADAIELLGKSFESIRK
jgi:DNA-binding transcriptional MocR family regulator